MKSICIGHRKIGPQHPAYIIAEIGHNHMGDLSLALDLIRAAAQCGVQAVKFQKRDNRNLYTPHFFDEPYSSPASYGRTYGLHREALELDQEDYYLLKDEALQQGVDFIVTPFDHPSLVFCDELDIDAIKVASGDLTNHALLEHAALMDKPVILSSGAATMDEVRLAYDLLTHRKVSFCLLHAVSIYPAPDESLKLNLLKKFKSCFPELILGYSGHDDDTMAAAIARSLEACVIEKHFTLDRHWRGTDHRFSLTPELLKQQVDLIRRTETMLCIDHVDKVVDPLEMSARRKMGKGIYLKRDLELGCELREEHLSYKSPATDLPPYMASKILGKTLARAKSAHEALSLQDFLS